jgi:hypothetical protein
VQEQPSRKLTASTLTMSTVNADDDVSAAPGAGANAIRVPTWRMSEMANALLDEYREFFGGRISDVVSGGCVDTLCVFILDDV